MATSLTSDDRGFASTLDGARVAQFLATQNWAIQSDLGYAQVWSEPGQLGQSVQRILVPRDTQLDDYELRLSQALERISDVYAWTIGDLAEQIATISADLFFVRVDQHMSDGTIPLRQGMALLENIDDMIRSAALTTANPFSSGRGRVPAIVNEFLNDDVRMGHTKRGSFIITVAARLDAPQTTQRDESHRGSDTTDERPVSFTRQVMTTLARSLEVTKLVAEQDPYAPDFDTAVDAGMKLPMVKALREMGSADGLRSLDMSFEWAPIEPQRETVSTKIDLPRETVLLLEEVSERLVRRDPPQNVQLTGPVVELRRGADSREDDEEGDVVIRADVNNVWRKVTIALAGVDYDSAIEAHRKKFPLMVSGVLEKKGRSWVLNSPVVDRSFLNFRAEPGESD